MLQPTQPARRAVAASGFRLMTADSEITLKPQKQTKATKKFKLFSSFVSLVPF
jgi:hypothetical protein